MSRNHFKVFKTICSCRHQFYNFFFVVSVRKNFKIFVFSTSSVYKTKSLRIREVGKHFLLGKRPSCRRVGKHFHITDRKMRPVKIFHY